MPFLFRAALATAVVTLATAAPALADLTITYSPAQPGQTGTGIRLDGNLDATVPEVDDVSITQEQDGDLVINRAAGGPDTAVRVHGRRSVGAVPRRGRDHGRPQRRKRSPRDLRGPRPDGDRGRPRGRRDLGWRRRRRSRRRRGRRHAQRRCRAWTSTSAMPTATRSSRATACRSGSRAAAATTGSTTTSRTSSPSASAAPTRRRQLQHRRGLRRRPGERLPGRAGPVENGVDEDCDGQDDRNLDRDGTASRSARLQRRRSTIRPGTFEIRGNDVDENCDQRALPFAPLASSSRRAGSSRPNVTRLRS